jgi:hypothetical protein
MAYGLQYVKTYYQMPFLKRGLRVNMHGRWATVTCGDGKYIRARFDGQRTSRRIHATWETTYYDAEGNIIKDYKEKKEESVHGT